MKANAEITRQSHIRFTQTRLHKHTRALRHTGASAKGEEEGESGQLTATGEIKKKQWSTTTSKGKDEEKKEGS